MIIYFFGIMLKLKRILFIHNCYVPLLWQIITMTNSTSLYSPLFIHSCERRGGMPYSDLKSKIIITVKTCGWSILWLRRDLKWRNYTFLECTSNIQECRENFHSDSIPADSASSVTRALNSPLFIHSYERRGWCAIQRLEIKDHC